MTDLPSHGSFPADALLVRRKALEDQGFICVHHDDREIVLVRKKFYWLAGIRISTIARVRRAASVDRQELDAGLRDMINNAGPIDPSKIPRGFQQMRNVLDVVLADEATEDAAAFALNTNRKGMGSASQSVLVRPDGSWTTCTPIWGAAYHPWIKHAAQVAATGESTPEPSATMGILIGILVMWPAIITVVASCCGIPLIVPIAAAVMEKDPEPAPLPGPA
ncbi:MAG: hypothetical protein H6742_21405 [Alphaproteobacteria bacterium]|nr:hypothetical protein [Alphaproteobacteria bacterium]